LEEKGLYNRSLEVPNLQSNELSFQEGTPITPSKDEETQDIGDLCQEILIVRITEIHELNDDSIERVNLDDYNSNDIDEYLSDTTWIQTQ